MLLVLLVPVPASVKQIVRSLRDDLVFGSIFSDILNTGVVELVPFVIDRVLGIGSVVAEAHVAKVVGDGIAVIDQVFASLALDVFAQVQASQRKADIIAQLLTTHASEHSQHPSISRPALLEPLQIDDKNRWSSIDLKLLGGLYMLLAFTAKPFIVFI